MDMGGGVVIEVDIKSYFDTLNAENICKTFSTRRVRDGVLRRAIEKWLNAGVYRGRLVCTRGQGSHKEVL